MSRRELELTLQFVYSHQTVLSWGVKETDGPEAEVHYLPKQFCDKGDLVRTLKNGEEVYEFTVPEWLAQQKGLV